ncbi:permease-like cell division protein FtsX [Neisseriaceae bacterium ESL0693]|nr:permease-like cell division protein FtsX [Neisseriaceae bacterium ESL0693]
MKQRLSLHKEAALKAWRQLFRQPVATLLILLMLAIAMTLPLVLYLGVNQAQQLLGQVDESPSLTLYMQLNANDADNRTVEEALKQDQRLHDVIFISKKQALTELQRSMGNQDLVSMLDSNPLPDAFTVMVRDDTPAHLQTLRDELKQLPMVESVKMDAEWVQTLYRLNVLVHRLLWFLACTLALAFALVSYNTIRLQILSHREEIEITKLLGAPVSFIRRPFIYLSLWQSLLSIGISLGLCWWLTMIMYPLIEQILKPYGIDMRYRFFDLTEIICIVVLVCGLGVMGAWLATRQHWLSFKIKA